MPRQDRLRKPPVRLAQAQLTSAARSDRRPHRPGGRIRSPAALEPSQYNRVIERASAGLARAISFPTAPPRSASGCPRWKSIRLRDRSETRYAGGRRSDLQRCVAALDGRALTVTAGVWYEASKTKRAGP